MLVDELFSSVNFLVPKSEFLPDRKEVFLEVAKGLFVEAEILVDQSDIVDNGAVELHALWAFRLRTHIFLFPLRSLDSSLGYYRLWHDLK